MSSDDSLTDAPESPLVRPIGQFETVLLLYAGLIAPVFSHLLLVPTVTGEIRYQSGLVRDQYGLILSFESLAWMYPLIGFSLVAFVTIVLDLEYSGNAAWARLGLTTSLPIGICYHVLFVMRLTSDLSEVIWYHVVPVVVVGVLWGGVKLLTWLLPDRRAVWLYGSVLLLGGTTLLSAVLVMITGDRSFFSLIVLPFGLILFGSFFYSPTLLLLSHGWLIARVLAVHPSARAVSLSWLLSWVTWLACFFAASRHAVVTSLESYSRLPTQDPGQCYVATAACRGHRRLVRSRQNRAGYHFNHQLQTLKAFEIAMQTLCPRFHHLLRGAYDRIGPPVARRLRSPLAADSTYLSLKPLEWAAGAVLTLLLGRQRHLVRRLYVDPLPGSTRANSRSQ